jgi:hypothetical protein
MSLSRRDHLADSSCRPEESSGESFPAMAGIACRGLRQHLRNSSPIIFTQSRVNPPYARTPTHLQQRKRSRLATKIRPQPQLVEKGDHQDCRLHCFPRCGLCRQQKQHRHHQGHRPRSAGRCKDRRDQWEYRQDHHQEHHREREQVLEQVLEREHHREGDRHPQEDLG